MLEALLSDAFEIALRIPHDGNLKFRFAVWNVFTQKTLPSFLINQKQSNGKPTNQVDFANS